MKKHFYALGIIVIAIFGVTGLASAITCPAGSHTFAGGTEASGYDMCIPDIGASGPVSGSSSQSSNTFTPSQKGTIAASGTTSETQAQGQALDAQVYSEVNRLSGTSIFSQAKALYDNSVSVNTSDYNSVVNQVRNLDDYTADPLKRAYNVRAIERLNQVWNQLMALETTYAQEQNQRVATPPPVYTPPVSTTPVSIPTTNTQPVTPPPPLAPPSPLAQYYGTADLQPGQLMTAPADKPANIVTPDQNIFLRAGSALKYIDQYTWQTVNGVFRFLEKTAINGRYKIRTNGGAYTVVRGTELIINEAPNATTITVIKGAVDVTPPKRKTAVVVKAGYQLVITGVTLNKPTKFNANALDTSWYQDIPAGHNFAKVSWQKVNASPTWSSDCTITSGQATATESLTTDEQAVLDALNQKALPVFRVHETSTVIGPSKISGIREKTTVNNGTKKMRIYTDGKALYYSGDTAGTVWKNYQDKNMISSITKNAKQENIVYYVDQGSLAFDHWEKAVNLRVAVYTAKATPAGTDSLIHSALNPAAPSSPEVANTKIYINEDTQQWTKSEANISYATGKILIPLHQTCQYTYDTAKIKLPTKAKAIDAKAGLAEMIKIYQAAQ